MPLRATLAFLAALWLTPAAWAAAPAANIVSIHGSGEFRPDERTAWAAARVEQDLQAGQFVRTGEFSRMGVLFRDRTQLRLNEKTVLQVKEGGAQTTVRLEVGRAWTQSKTLPNGLRMETPSATAAIRGTDWDIEVDGDGRAVLTVLSGEVEFYNDFGRLLVKENEAAEARVGRAPTRLVIVRPRDRVQWVTSYAVVPLRHIALSGRRPGELDGALAGAAPAERGRILADLGRWSEAEAAFGAADPIGAGYAALRRGKLDAARAQFERAGKPTGADAELLALGRAALAIHEERFAPAIAQLGALTREPSQPAAFLLLADLMIFSGDLEKATGYLNQGLARFPGDPRLHSALARAHLLAGEPAKGRDALARARGRDAASVDADLAEGDLARIEGDGAGAAAAYGRAIAGRPADDRGWYGLGRVNTEKEAVREGRSHLRKALELDPRGPGYLGELGTLESFANNFDEAHRLFTAALAQNPDDYVALTGLGLLELKRGNTETALNTFLRAGLMEPRYARARVYTAVAYYQTGRIKEALDELKRAAELDDKDPLPHFMTSVIYTDTMRPALALESARTALRLLPYLKSLNQLANDQQGLTNLGQAFAFLGMEEWAQSYAQDSYYPFWAGSHLFLADRYPGLFAKNSELFQGFLADPTVFGGSNRFQTLMPKPIQNFSVSQRVSAASGLVHGTGPYAQLSGFANASLPLAYFVDHEVFDLSMKDGPSKQATTTAAFGVMPRHDLGMLFYADQSDLDSTYDVPSAYRYNEKLKSGRADVGLHYKLAPDSQLWFKGGVFDSKDDAAGSLGVEAFSLTTKVHQPEMGVRHTFDAGAGHELTWGIEQGRRTTTTDFYIHDPFHVGFFDDHYLLAVKFEERSLDAYVSDRWRASPRLLVQGDLFYQRHRRTADQTDHAVFQPPFDSLNFSVAQPGDVIEHNRVNPRLGLAYRFDAGPQLRLAYQRWMRPALFSSLGPVATAGIALDDRLVMRGGELDRLRGQLEWEHSPRGFVSAFLDHKKIDNHRFSITTPFAINELESLGKLRPRRLGSLANDDMLEFVSTPEFDGGVIRSGGININHLLTEQWGVFGRYVATSSRNTGTAYSGNKVPYLPRHTFALGATWVEPGGWYFISRLVHRSSRYKDEANAVELRPGWNAAADLYWQSPDKRWLLRFSIDNAVDRNGPTQYTAEVNIRF